MKRDEIPLQELGWWQAQTEQVSAGPWVGGFQRAWPWEGGWVPRACSLLFGVAKGCGNFHNANCLANIEADFWELRFQSQRGLSVSWNSSSLKYVAKNCPAHDSWDQGVLLYPPSFSFKTMFIFYVAHPGHTRGSRVFLNKHTDSQGKKSQRFVTIPLFSHFIVTGHLSSFKFLSFELLQTVLMYLSFL